MKVVLGFGLVPLFEGLLETAWLFRYFFPFLRWCVCVGVCVVCVWCVAWCVCLRVHHFQESQLYGMSGKRASWGLGWGELVGTSGEGSGPHGVLGTPPPKRG